MVKHLFPHSLILQLSWVRLTAFSTGGHGLHVRSHPLSKDLQCSPSILSVLCHILPDRHLFSDDAAEYQIHLRMQTCCTAWHQGSMSCGGPGDLACRRTVFPGGFLVAPLYLWPLEKANFQRLKTSNQKKLSKSLLIYFEEVLHHKLIKSSIPYMYVHKIAGWLFIIIFFLHKRNLNYW